MSKVWRLQVPTNHRPRDYSSCEQFGAMSTVLSSDDRPSYDPDKYLDVFLKAFQYFQDGDYVLFAGGDPITPFLASIALYHLGYDKVNWLRWDKTRDLHGKPVGDEGSYSPVLVDLSTLGEYIEQETTHGHG